MISFPSKKFLLIFFSINLLLSSFYLDNRRNPNATSRVLQVASLAEDGVLHIDQRKDETLDKAYSNDHYYPLQPPLPSLLAFPIYKVLKSIGICEDYNIDNGNSIFRLGSFLLGSLSFSFLVFFLFIQLIKSNRSLADSLILSTLPLYASLFFLYAGVFYSHLLVGFCIYLSFIFIKDGRSFFFAGILSGIAFFSEYLTAIIFAIWFFQILFSNQLKNAIYYGLGLLPFVLLFMFYNYSTTGNPLHTVYSHNLAYDMQNVGFTFPRITALFQMIFSPWRGALIFMPVLIALLFSLDWKWNSLKNLLSNKALFPVLIFTLALSSYEEWHGGWTYGPRYLMPAMIILYAAYVNRITLTGTKKFIFWIPVSLGLIYAIIAKIGVGYDIPSKFNYPFFQYALPKVLRGEFMDTAIMGISSGISAVIFLSLVVISVVALYLVVSRR